MGRLYNKLKRHRQRATEVMLLIGVFVVSFLPMIVALDGMSFHGDESHWISEGIACVHLILQGKFSDPYWFTGPDWYQPPVAKYLIGFALLLFGVKEGEWQYWGVPLKGEIPPNYVLAISRLPMAVMGALSCVLVFLLGKELKDRWTGIIASLFLAFNPLWLSCSRRAMSDTPSVFFSTLSIFLFWLGIKNIKSHTQSLIYFVIAGISVGLAIDSKYTSIMTFLLIILFTFLVMVPFFSQHLLSSSSKMKFRAVTAIGLVLFVGMGVLTTIVLNPYLYLNPYQQFNNVVGFWSRGSQYWGYRVQDTPNDKINAFIGTIHSVVWPGCQVLKAIWPSYQWSWEYPGSYTTVPMAASFVLGMTYLLNRIRKKETSFIEILILMWFLIYLVFISMVTWKLWDRYFLPLIPSMTLIAAYGLTWFCRRMLRVDWVLITTTAVSHAGNILAWLPELYNKQWPDANNDYALASLQLSIGRDLGFIFAVGYSIVLLFTILWYLRKHLRRYSFHS